MRMAVSIDILDLGRLPHRLILVCSEATSSGATGRPAGRVSPLSEEAGNSQLFDKARPIPEMEQAAAEEEAASTAGLTNHPLLIC